MTSITVKCKPPILYADRSNPDDPKYYYWEDGKLVEMDAPGHAELLIWTGESKEEPLTDDVKASPQR